MTIRYDGKVAIITGAGGGLGRSHAIEMAKRGAKVVVNDLGGSVNGEGQNSDAAMAVVAEIEALGGEAMAHPANVANADDVAAMVEKVMAQWGRIDILVNNAGILRDKSFTENGLGRFPDCPRSAFDGHSQLHKSRLGHHEGSGVWPHCGDFVFKRALR